MHGACRPFTNNKEKKRIKICTNIYQNELDKTCLQHDISYGDFKDLTRRTASNNLLLDKGFNIAENPNYGGYQSGLQSVS